MLTTAHPTTSAFSNRAPSSRMQWRERVGVAERTQVAREEIFPRCAVVTRELARGCALRYSFCVRSKKPSRVLVTESPAIERVRASGLSLYVIDLGSRDSAWASAEGARGTRADRLVDALMLDLASMRPVAMGVPTPLVFALRGDGREAAAPMELRALASIFTRLRELQPLLRAFGSWDAFEAAPNPKLLVWEAGPQKDNPRPDLDRCLASFGHALPSIATRPMEPAHDLISLLGVLLLKAGLTDSLEALSLPSLVIDDCEHEANRIRERRKADEEFIVFLVRQAMNKVLIERGVPTPDQLAAERQRRDREEQELDRRYRIALSLPARPPGYEQLVTPTPGVAQRPRKKKKPA